jgi:hypothetical protein
MWGELLVSDLAIGREVLVAGRREFRILKNCTAIEPRVF